VAEAVVTGAVTSTVTGIVAGPAEPACPLDATGIFIDSSIYAEPFRVARRPGRQLLEVADDMMLMSGRPAGPPAQWRGACGCKSLKGRRLMSRTKFAAWLMATDGQAGGYLR
jgi:hypothetical protein